MEHLEGQGISEEETIWRALDSVKVEARVGEAYIDVYLDFPPFERWLLRWKPSTALSTRHRGLWAQPRLGRSS